jgi:hypothetical protein
MSESSDNAGVRLITTSKTEKDIAADLKARLIDALAPILALCNEANANDLDVQLVFARDNFGKLKLTPILIKHY